ncbi:metal ABC transporter ATP-binding protein [Symbiobacterium thermophilum]|uniref:metal ABC transporter ATP-binding protein n=1 Tax=Symbiobacterium thermophilum TaxID=2734 RepID=UPI000313D489|nr:metal ABC transporter ATP-binding protein [Symbiobacterium thermophilum]
MVATSPVIEVRNVSFGYGKDLVLDRVSLTVGRGEYLGLIGPNGSGKTTLLRLILGLLPLTQGEIRLFGTPVQQFRERWRVGYVAQKAASFNSAFPATVEEVVSTGLTARRGLFRRFTASDRLAVRQALDRVGLLPYKDRLVGRLSGGQQQRVFIARALVSRPELLILDEPTVGVDASAEGQFYRLIRRLREEMGLTVILVSHDIGAITHEVSALACLNRRLFYHGSPADFGTEEQLCELYGHDVLRIHHHHHRGEGDGP